MAAYSVIFAESKYIEKLTKACMKNSVYMIVFTYFLFNSYLFSKESHMTSDCHVWFHKKRHPFTWPLVFDSLIFPETPLLTGDELLKSVEEHYKEYPELK